MVGDTVMVTGNDGVLRVSMMVEDDRGVFEQVPGEKTLFRDKKLWYERILSPSLLFLDTSAIFVSA